MKKISDHTVMFASSKTNVILAIFVLVGVLYISLLLNKTYFSKSVEKFESADDDDADVDSSDKGIDKAYASRLYVIKLFDAIINRKPTDDEVEKYSSFSTDKAIMNAIMGDYDVLTTGQDETQDNFEQDDDQDPEPEDPEPEAKKSIKKSGKAKEDDDEIESTPIKTEPAVTFKPVVKSQSLLHDGYDKNLSSQAAVSKTETLKIKIDAFDRAYIDLKAHLSKNNLV